MCQRLRSRLHTTVISLSLILLLMIGDSRFDEKVGDQALVRKRKVGDW